MITDTDRELVSLWAAHGIPDNDSTLSAVAALLTKLLKHHDALVDEVNALCDLIARLEAS